MKFADIPGHEDIKRRLREMVDSDRIPHALLLEGPSGAGKYMLARALAQYIHCTNRSGGDSCGKCAACLQHQSFNHIDTFYSFPVVKDGVTISDDYIDLYRDFLKESPYMDFTRWLEMLGNINAQPRIYVDEGNELLRRLSYMTRRSRFKVVLMWLPERMNDDTANKLLKLVEEPFGDTLFVMTSDNPRLILPTIYSRTQRVLVRRYNDDELRNILVAGGASQQQADDLAHIAEGDVNLALRLATHSNDQQQHFELFTSLMRLAYARKVADLRAWSLKTADLGREKCMEFIGYACRMVRESFLMHLHDERLLNMSAAEHQFVAKFYPFINEKNVEDMIAMFDRARTEIAGNGSAKIVLFDVAVRIIMLIRRK